MDEKSCAAQIAHIKRCISALRLFDLTELQECVQVHGSKEDQELVTAVVLALETLPPEPH